MFRDKQFWPCTLGQDDFLKTLIPKFLGTYPSYKKYFKNFHHRFTVKNLEFQIYSEKNAQKAAVTFYA